MNARSPHSQVDWNSLPPSVDPARGGRLGAADDGTRGERKRWQVESIYAVMYQLLQHVHVPVRSLWASLCTQLPIRPSTRPASP